MTETFDQCNARIDSASEKLDTINAGTSAFLSVMSGWATSYASRQGGPMVGRAVAAVGAAVTTGAKLEIDKASDAYVDAMREAQCKELPTEAKPEPEAEAGQEPGAGEGTLTLPELTIGPDEAGVITLPEVTFGPAEGTEITLPEVTIGPGDGTEITLPEVTIGPAEGTQITLPEVTLGGPETSVISLPEVTLDPSDPSAPAEPAPGGSTVITLPEVTLGPAEAGAGADPAPVGAEPGAAVITLPEVILGAEATGPGIADPSLAAPSAAPSAEGLLPLDPGSPAGSGGAINLGVIDLTSEPGGGEAPGGEQTDASGGTDPVGDGGHPMDPAGAGAALSGGGGGGGGAGSAGPGALPDPATGETGLQDAPGPIPADGGLPDMDPASGASAAGFGGGFGAGGGEDALGLGPDSDPTEMSMAEFSMGGFSTNDLMPD